MNIYHKFQSARRQTQLILIAILFALIWKTWPDTENRDNLRAPNTAVAAAQPCIMLNPDIGSYKEAVIWKQGIYCIDSNFWQRRLSDGAGHSGPAPYRHLLAVRASHVTVDLRNHILHSDGHSSGIAFGLDEQERVKQAPSLQSYRMPYNVTIKNGVIDLRGLGNGVFNFNKWRMYTIDETVPSEFEGYEKSNIVLENLLIKTDNTSVILEGEGNIIRNCVIESGGSGAIMMAGPNGQILNNTIILTAPFIPGNMRGVDFSESLHFSELFKERRAPKAAIALHQATGTFISGNRIEVKGKSPTRHNIYLTDASKNVRIEGNTFVGTGDPVTLANGSTATMKGNVTVQLKPWWKF